MDQVIQALTTQFTAEPAKQVGNIPLKIIAIAGGPCSGKSTLCDVLAHKRRVAFVIDGGMEGDHLGSTRSLIKKLRKDPGMAGRVVVVCDQHALDVSIREFCDIKIFIECKGHVAQSRYLERNGSVGSIKELLANYYKEVEKSEDYLRADKKFADIIIPNSVDISFEAKKVIDLLVSWIDAGTKVNL